MRERDTIKNTQLIAFFKVINKRATHKMVAREK